MILANREVNSEVGDVVYELSTYILPGRVLDPSQGIDQAIIAERTGFNQIWIGERFDLKNIGVLTGALAALTSRINVASGLVAMGAYHPVIVAAWAETVHGMFGERLTVGLGRSVAGFVGGHGMKVPSYKATEDYVNILRKLWRGETVDYDGPLGRFPNCQLVDRSGVQPPKIILGIFGGPKSVETAARCADGVLLTPMLTAKAVGKAVRDLREASERNGRDPNSLHIVCGLIVAPELDEQETVEIVHARAVTYLQMKNMGEYYARYNEWDTAKLERWRAHPFFDNIGDAAADQAYHRSQLLEVARALPEHWMRESAAYGSVNECCDRLEEYFDAGVDEICFHGALPAQSKSLLAKWRERQQGGNLF